MYYDGAFHADSAVLALVTTNVPFRIFKTQHFVLTEQRVVVTAADAQRRIVSEIDGMPAAESYAQFIGADVQTLDPAQFATKPVLVLVDGTNYVRSIQKANPDGSLTFFCAIQEGIILRKPAVLILSGIWRRRLPAYGLQSALHSWSWAATASCASWR